MASARLNRKAKDLLDALREAASIKPQVIPAGWYTLGELTKRLRRHRTRVNAALEEVGAESRVFMVANKLGKLRPQRYWHLPEKQA